MRPELVVIGVSLGGLAALEAILSALPKQWCIPLVVAQHRSAESTEALVQALRRHTRLKVREPEDKEPIRQGYVYVAAPDYHLLVDGDSFALSTDEPVSYARPSVDVLFESAADAYGPRLVGVVLTGANSDGARGAARIKQAGGAVIVQDPETADCAVMPRAAIGAARVDYVLDLPGIGRYLAGLCDPEPAPGGHVDAASVVPARHGAAQDRKSMSAGDNTAA